MPVAKTEDGKVPPPRPDKDAWQAISATGVVMHMSSAHVSSWTVSQPRHRFLAQQCQPSVYPACFLRSSTATLLTVAVFVVQSACKTY